MSARFDEVLSRIPPPGAGCHTALLGAANVGIRSGVTPNDVERAIRQAIPSGARHIPEREIRDAVRKATVDAGKPVTGFRRDTPPQPTFNAERARQRIIKAGSDFGEADLWERAPIRLDWMPGEDWRALPFLWPSDALLWLGGPLDAGERGKTIRPVAEWVEAFGKGETLPPHIIINPLSGVPSPKKSGDGVTLRGDACVSHYVYAVAEFDTLPRDQQLAFWAGIELPIAALVDSGGKSVHAWLRVDRLGIGPIADADGWTTHIRTQLYRHRLIPLGVDPACANESRLTRMPGHYRTEKRQFQRLLYLNPDPPVEGSIAHPDHRGVP